MHSRFSPAETARHDSTPPRNIPSAPELSTVRRILDPQGNLVNGAEPRLSLETTVDGLRWMVLGRVSDARATAVQRQGRLGTDSPVQEASRGARSRTSTPGRQSECDDSRTSYSTMTAEALARASGISFEAIRDGLTFETDHDERVIVLGLRRRQAG